MSRSPRNRTRALVVSMLALVGASLSLPMSPQPSARAQTTRKDAMCTKYSPPTTLGCDNGCPEGVKGCSNALPETYTRGFCNACSGCSGRQCTYVVDYSCGDALNCTTGEPDGWRCLQVLGEYCR